MSEIWNSFFIYCKIKDLNLIKHIGELCKYDLDVFFNNYHHWNTIYSLNKEQVINILNTKKNLDIQLDSFEQMKEIFPKQEFNFKAFRSFLASSKIIIDEELAKWTFNKQRELVIVSPTANNMLNVTSNFSIMAKQIFPKLVNLAKQNPTYILQCGDEILAYIRDLSLNDIAMNNVYASSLLLGALCVFSVGKRLEIYGKLKKEGKSDLIENFWKPVAIDFAANSSACLLTGLGGFVGAVLLSWIPFLGTTLGGIVGTLCAGLLAKNLIEPMIRKEFTVEVIDSLKNINSEEELYQNACAQLNVPVDVSKDSLKETRMNNLKNWHPDRNSSLSDEMKKTYSDKLVELELYHTIIKKHRQFD